MKEDSLKMTSILEVENLKLAYGEYQVLEKVSFSAKRGKCTVLMGGSGCGKSTLLKSMVGLLEPQEGRVLVDTIDLWAVDQAEKTSILKKYGVLFQGGALWGSMNLVENVSLPLETYTELSEAEINDLARYKLNLVGLSGYGDFYPAQLSGGMKKRAGLARAMALDPDILFLDEPSAGLDPINSHRLDNLINELKVSLGITFIVVTHELPSIFDIADDSIFLDGETKTLLAQGRPSDLRENSEHDRVRSFLRRGTPISKN
ncbi:MAG: ATP-binding cassette domain-containing protein [Opitutales bacterium]|nr:ATP-binding cassette domain-containing protein [Opitutales bacterium]